MNKIWATIKNEPVRVYSVLASIVMAATAFGFNLSQQQSAAVLAIIAALLGGGQAVRSIVTPTVSIPTVGNQTDAMTNPYNNGQTS